MKLTDHIATDNEHWRNLLFHVQKSDNAPITYVTLSNLRFGKLTGWDLSLDLWNFVSKRFGTNIYERRKKWVNGEEGNGFELWRRLFVEYEGGDEVVQNDGRTRLQSFPSIARSELGPKLDDWEELFREYGDDIGDRSKSPCSSKYFPRTFVTKVFVEKN